MFTFKDKKKALRKQRKKSAGLRSLKYNNNNSKIHSKIIKGELSFYKIKKNNEFKISEIDGKVDKINKL